MLRRSFTLRRVSPFSLFQKHLGKTGVLKGLKHPLKKSSELYRRLSTPERKMFEERARRVTYPALDAYNRFQKQYASRFVHLPMKQRQRKVAQVWAELKMSGKLKIPKVAARKIKAAAKKKVAKKKTNRSISTPSKVADKKSLK
ncbi:hypothetical protein Q4I30_006867 [Leishmania utingensis]|uniref:Kinetoplast DNA-associated protein n=1 Tax=Leishmania utingensis TaxID=653362 RepID=A0AAW3A4G0_9TRYP